MLTVPELPATPDQQFADEVVRRLRDAGYVAYWAGGCVRDLLLGKRPKDYDVATDARPEAVQQLFGHKRTKAVGAAFGVILVHGPRGCGDVEVATFRAEGPYLDGRRPESVVFCTPEQDAQRRDFTINGMFFDPFSRQVFDYVGGQADLKEGVIRAIGNPVDRFREDKLRILRAIRFTATMGFRLETATAAAIRDMAPEVRIVSVERITQEWKRMLVHPNCRQALELAHDTQVLPFIFPECHSLFEAQLDSLWHQSLTAVTNLQHHFANQTPPRVPGFEVILATWLRDAPGYTADVAIEMCQRLKFSNDELERIAWLRRQADALLGARTFSLSRLKRLLASRFIDDLIAQTKAILQATGGQLQDIEFCESYLRQTPPEVLNPPPLISGNELIRLGLRPGKTFKVLLETLRDAQLEGRISTPAEALALAQELAAATPTTNPQ